MDFVYLLERVFKGVIYFFAFIFLVLSIFIPFTPFLIDYFFVANAVFSIFLLLMASYAYIRTNLSLFPFLLGVGAFYHFILMIISTKQAFLQAYFGRLISYLTDLLINQGLIVSVVIGAILAILMFAFTWKLLSHTMNKIPLERIRQGEIDEEKRHSGEENQEGIFLRKNQFSRKMASVLKLIKINTVIAPLLCLFQMLIGAWLYDLYGVEMRESLKLYGYLAIGMCLLYQIFPLLHALAAWIITARIFKDKESVS